MPPKPISLAVINREALKDDEKKKPFAKLHIKLLKTYSNPACKDYEEENEVPSYGGMIFYTYLHCGNIKSIIKSGVTLSP